MEESKIVLNIFNFVDILCEHGIETMGKVMEKERIDHILRLMEENYIDPTKVNIKKCKDGNIQFDYIGNMEIGNKVFEQYKKDLCERHNEYKKQIEDCGEAYVRIYADYYTISGQGFESHFADHDKSDVIACCDEKIIVEFTPTLPIENYNMILYYNAKSYMQNKLVDYANYLNDNSNNVCGCNKISGEEKLNLMEEYHKSMYEIITYISENICMLNCVDSKD